MPLPAVTAIVPTFGRPELLAQALATFRNQTHPFAEIIVVDDGSAEPIPNATIRLPQNRGFAVAVNAGWAQARTPWVAVLNNDCLLSPTWLEQLTRGLAESAERDEPWFATGRLLRPDGRLDGAWDLISCAGFPWRVGHGQPDGPEWQVNRRIPMASFTASLWRTSLREKIGLLDEAFGTYLEDVDYSLRCVRHGMAGVYVGGAVATHLGSATGGIWSKFFVRQFTRNQQRIIEKHWPGGLGQYVRHFRKLWGMLALRHLRVARFGELPEVEAEEALPIEVICAMEAELRALMPSPPPDRLWRMYFQWVDRHPYPIPGKAGVVRPLSAKGQMLSEEGHSLSAQGQSPPAEGQSLPAEGQLREARLAKGGAGGGAESDKTDKEGENRP